MSTQEKIKSALSSLQEKKEAFETMRKSYEDTATYIQVKRNPEKREGRWRGSDSLGVFWFRSRLDSWRG